jgi:hypothetical protein
MTDGRPKRISVRYFPSREGSILEGHAYLLARDIPLGILPIRAARDNPNFQVELFPSDEGRETWLTKFLDVGRYERHTLAEGLVEFVETAADFIGHYGEIFLEILPDEDGSPLEVSPLAPGRVVPTPRSYWQVIPKKDREQFGKPFVSIPRDRIWRLTLPRQLGSPGSHRRLLRRLAALSDPAMPDFVLRNPLDQGRSTGYDFGVERAAEDRLMERATRRWGTTMSIQRPVGDSNEYFFISRRLAFLEAQALLREHLIAEINRLMRRLKIDASIKVTGIPTASEIAESLKRLHRGEISFAEALDSTRI